MASKYTATDPIPDEVQARIKDCGPLSLLTKDDCPVYITNSPGAARPGNIHHPNFGKRLEEEMKKIGVECVRRVGANKGMAAEKLAWFKKHFKMGK